MKKILIDKICLRYFKGVENKEIVLGDNINVVKGRNGIGNEQVREGNYPFMKAYPQGCAC